MRKRDTQVTVDSWLWGQHPWRSARHRAQTAVGRMRTRKRFFLHRAYLTWFARTIRSHLHDDNRALPCWDYSDPTRPKVMGLPPEFLVAKRIVGGTLAKNPLFLSSDDRPGPPAAADVDVAPALSQRFRLPISDAGFGGIDGARKVGGLLEMLLHNYIHGDIGGDTGFMRTHSLAARDPIFWLHHANFDRFWALWQTLPGSVELHEQGGAPTSIVSDWNAADFAFGGNGATTVYSMKQLLTTTNAPLGDMYQTTDLAPAVLAAVTANRHGGRPGPMGLDDKAPQQPRWDPIAATTERTDVGEDSAHRELSFDAGQMGLAAQTPSGLNIELSGVRARATCHNAYVAARWGSPSHHAGRFSTFGLGGAPQEEERDFVIDATGLIPALVEDGWRGREVVVCVSPEPESGGSSTGDDGMQIQRTTVYRRR
jgi:tyrosinase